MYLSIYWTIPCYIYIQYAGLKRLDPQHVGIYSRPENSNRSVRYPLGTTSIASLRAAEQNYQFFLIPIPQASGMQGGCKRVCIYIQYQYCGAYHFVCTVHISSGYQIFSRGYSQCSGCGVAMEVMRVVAIGEPVATTSALMTSITVKWQSK